MAAVILGGIKRIGAVTSKLVPYMAVIYVAGGLAGAGAEPRAPFPACWPTSSPRPSSPPPSIGGFAGGTFIFMLTWGVKRGLFSNESGQGSAPIAHAAAKTDEPVREGVVAMMGPMIDTLIICTITGLVILSTGVWHAQDARLGAGQRPVGHHGDQRKRRGADRRRDRWTRTCSPAPWSASTAGPRTCSWCATTRLVELPVFVEDDGTPFAGELTVDDGDIETEGLPALTLNGDMAQNGSPLTAWAFQEGLRPILGNWGYLIITLGVVLFGISTAISWSYYGDRAVVYLFGTELHSALQDDLRV